MSYWVPNVVGHSKFKNCNRPYPHVALVSLGRGGSVLAPELAVGVAELRSGGNNILESTGTDSKPGGSGTGIPSLVVVAALSSMSTLLERLVIGKQVAPVRIPFETLLLIGSWLLSPWDCCRYVSTCDQK
jgi:hypothetical protein